MTRTQAAMVDAEPLLRVMDGFAEVDARMRWAGNKLLHFEIGVIQAVQTLGEVTLSTVMDAIRGGAPPSPPRSSGTASAATPVSATSSQPPTARKPSAAPRADVPEPPPVAQVSTGGDFWQQFLSQVETGRPLVFHWLESAAPLSHEGKYLKIALPESESAARDNLLRAPTRKYLEEVAQSLLGRSLLLEVALDPNLKVPEPMAPPATVETHSADVDSGKPLPVADEMDNELIRVTVEKFKATLLAS